MYRLLLIVMFFLPVPAWSQGAPVQTGEHLDFTRVVVTIPDQAAWQLGRNDQGYLLRVPGIRGYDLRRFFDLIPRERILDARMGPAADTLQFFVTCDCYVDAFIDRPNILVIDVKSGTPPADSVFEQRIPDEPSLALAATNVSSTVPAYEVPQSRLLPLIIPRTDISEPVTPVANVTSDTTVEEQIGPSQALASLNNQESADRDADLQALEQSITESLARALSQGVLVPDIGRVSGDQADASRPNLLSPGVALRTGIDLTAVPRTDTVDRTQAGQACPPDTLFDVASWGNDLPFSDQIASLRASFVGEFDRFDEATLLAKARLYVHFGFGREAMQTLQMDGTLSQERQYLIAMAQIMDDNAVAPTPFANLVSCQTAVALWALLAAKDGGLDGKVDAASVLRAFKALPLHLQSHLGPRLSERFLSIGDEESALQALSSAVEDPTPSVEAELAEAELMQELGETDEANAALTRLARTESRTTPQAVTAFFEAAIRDDIMIDAADFALADALRFEHASTPEAEALALAQIGAYLHQANFDAARNLIDELAPSAEPSILTEMNAAFAEAVLNRATDLQFLDVAFGQLAANTTSSISVGFADRLLDLGFPTRAAEILETIEPTVEDHDIQYLRAEAALMMGDATSATRMLGVLDTPQATALAEAAVSVALGRSFDRTQLSKAAGEAQSWQRSDWTALSRSTDPLLRDVSNEILQGPSTLSADMPLASGLELLEQSERSRDVVERLLRRFERPADS